MASDKDYYQILEVREDASEEVIRMAYKALALKYHPDRYKGDSASANRYMQKINEAYEVLSDPIKRQRYNENLRMQRHQHEEAEHGRRESNRSEETGQQAAAKRKKDADEQKTETEPLAEDKIEAQSIKRKIMVALTVTVLIVIITVINNNNNNIQEVEKIPNVSNIANEGTKNNSEAETETNTLTNSTTIEADVNPSPNTYEKDSNNSTNQNNAALNETNERDVPSFINYISGTWTRPYDAGMSSDSGIITFTKVDDSHLDCYDDGSLDNGNIKNAIITKIASMANTYYFECRYTGGITSDENGNMIDYDMLSRYAITIIDENTIKIKSTNQAYRSDGVDYYVGGTVFTYHRQ